MGLQFTWLGHSAFQMHIDEHEVLFDPFLTGNPLASAHPDSLNPELIFLSHAHGDHLGDTVAIAQRTGCGVISNAEISYWLKAHGVQHAHGQNTGGSADYDFLTCKLTIAFHSSSFPDGAYGGSPNGFIITAKESGKRVYFAGDTALFSDMALIGEERIDLAFIPIGDYFTMGIADSIRAIKYIQPRYVVPMHYNTFPLIAQSAVEWANRVSNETNAQPIVLDPGGSFIVRD
ncbi:metal-dependent hydrolase [Anaerolineae bacterium CFX9]|nr:metal-dependent hydrolase [Anaerolineae bacterium CFX9]